VNNHNYARAWQINDAAHQTSGDYAHFKQGFAQTQQVNVMVTHVSGDVVSVQIASLQTNGTTKYFSGTYTVQNGMIVAANISKISNLSRREADQQLVDNAARVSAIGAVPAGPRPCEHGSVQHVDGRLDARLLAQLAGGDAASQDAADNLATRLDNRLDVPFKEARIGPALAKQQGELARTPRIRRFFSHCVDHCRKVFSDRLAPRLGQRRFHRTDGVEQ
jgi:hypothetical protein